MGVLDIWSPTRETSVNHLRSGRRPNSQRQGPSGLALWARVLVPAPAQPGQVGKPPWAVCSPSLRKLGGSPGREGAGPGATSLPHRAICQGLCTEGLAPTPSSLIGCLRAHKACSAVDLVGEGDRLSPSPHPPGKSQSLAPMGVGRGFRGGQGPKWVRGRRGAHVLGRGRGYLTSGKKKHTPLPRFPHLGRERGTQQREGGGVPCVVRGGPHIWEGRAPVCKWGAPHLKRGKESSTFGERDGAPHSERG